VNPRRLRQYAIRGNAGRDLWTKMARDLGRILGTLWMRSKRRSVASARAHLSSDQRRLLPILGHTSPSTGRECEPSAVASPPEVSTAAPRRGDPNFFPGGHRGLHIIRDSR